MQLPDDAAPRAKEWLARGSFSTWRPESGPAAGRDIEIFHLEAGDPDAPPIVLVHGFPTSSIDWSDIIDDLAQSHRVCALDFPGYGFSDKPTDWPYSLEVDADLLVHHARDVLGVEACRVVAHDRGDSVALIAHERAARAGAGPQLTFEHLVLTNGNIFLPLASLTTFQKLILDPGRWPEVREVVKPEMLAAGMGLQTFTPPRSAEDPTVTALAATFAANDGVAVLHDTVQYLRERAAHESEWLDALSGSDVPTTVVWGLCDTVSPPRVALHVWEAFLRAKPGSNELWLVPDANHYVQNDRPDALVAVLRQAFQRTGPTAPGALDSTPGAPVRIDHSAAELPAATDGFAAK